MQTEFNVVIKSIHTIQVNLPGMGDTVLPADQEIQLLNASLETVNYLRNTFAGTGVTVSIGKKAAHPYTTHDYKIRTKEDIEKEEAHKEQSRHLTPFETVANYELPSGKHQGKKLKELDDNTLKVIARNTKAPVVKSAIEAYLNLK